MSEKHDNIIPDDVDLAAPADPEFASIEELDNFESELLESVEAKKQDRPPNEKTQKATSTSEQATLLATQQAQQSEQSRPITAHAEKTQKNSKVPEPVNSRRPLRKDQLVQNILRLQELVPGYTTKSKTYYTRKKVAELQMILSDLTERGADSLQGIENNSQNDSESEEVVDADTLPKGVPNPTTDAGSALFAFNVIVAQFCEAVSINYEDKIGTNLKGFTQDIVDNRQQLEECLSEIYAENADILDPYLSGTNRYFLMMTSLGGQRLIRNRIKKNAPEEEDA